jgi:hypothetical protein
MSAVRPGFDFDYLFHPRTSSAPTDSQPGPDTFLETIRLDKRRRFFSVKEVRTDVWPEPKTASEVEERFLKLPDSEDYTRVRQFNIDAKGAVVSRGDSFRRKKRTTSGRCSQA